jgi:hypothetical protein
MPGGRDAPLAGDVVLDASPAGHRLLGILVVEVLRVQG